MLKKITTIGSLAFGVILLSSGALSDNGKAGRTGSPGELTCIECHDDFTLNSGGGSITLGSTNMTNWEYVPGTTYHMTATVARNGMPLFGVGVEALSPSNTNAGTLTATNTSVTTKSATINGTSRKSVVHTLNGGASNNSKTFNFDWSAPATNIGNVTFYFAGVASNADGDETVGDYVYTGNHVVTPALSTGVTEITPGVDINVYPNPVSDMLKVDYALADAGRVEIMLYDLNGRLVENLVSAQRLPGRHTEMIGGMDQQAAGSYVLRLNLAGAITTRTLVLQH